MKKYFLQFDFWNDSINKFFYGVVTVDLKEAELVDVCRRILRDKFPDVCAEDATIKVNALNNIEL